MNFDVIIKKVQDKKIEEEKKRIEAEVNRDEIEARERAKNKVRAEILAPLIDEIKNNKNKIDKIFKELKINYIQILDNIRLSLFSSLRKGLPSVDYTVYIEPSMKYELRRIEVFVFAGEDFANKRLFMYDFEEDELIIYNSIAKLTSDETLDFFLKEFVRKANIEKRLSKKISQRFFTKRKYYNY